MAQSTGPTNTAAHQPEGSFPDAPASEKLLLHQIGHYRLLEPLGQGGMGCVYKAMHLRLKKVVALKMLPAKQRDNPDAIARFQREMEAIGHLDHPNIVRGTDAGETGGYHYLVMELLAGIDLSKLADRNGPLRVEDAAELMRQAAVGLAYAHEHGVVHRDVKPSNLFLTSAGIVKLLDLGLARLPPDGLDLEQVTSSGQLLGTADYMAPEQVWDPRQVDIRADLYSLGCSLYRLLAGRPPFSGPSYDTFYKKINAHTQTPIPPIGNLRSDLPQGLHDLLERLLAKKPQERLDSPAAAVEALAVYAAGANLVGLLEALPPSAVKPPHFAAAPSPFAQGLLASTSEDAPTRPLPSTAKKSRRRWPYLVLFGSFALGAAALASTLALRDRSPFEDTLPKKLDDGFPLAWQNLLTISPAVAFWPKNLPDAHWRFDDKKQELFLVTHHYALFTLGTTARQQDYALRVNMVQTRWTGDLGLFFGWQEFEADGIRCQQCQVVELHRYMVDRDPWRAFQMQRRKMLIRHLPNQDPSISFGETIGSLAIPMPNSPEQFLEIKVDVRGLASVSWGGDVLTLMNLTTPDANRKFAPRDYQGGFGIYSYWNTSAFRDARFMLLERTSP